MDEKRPAPEIIIDKAEDDAMQDFSPASNPAWKDPVRAAAIPYPGVDAPPNFDYELENLEVCPKRGTVPSVGYEERWRAIARYHALGFRNSEIAKKLGYSDASITRLLEKDWLKAEVARFRNQYYEADIHQALKNAGPDAIKHIHESILNENEKSEIRSTNARWVTEKLTGKPKQEVNVESNSLTAFMELARQMVNAGPQTPQLLDVTGTAGEPSDAQQQPESISKYDRFADEL